jgi:hypothetical protein
MKQILYILSVILMLLSCSEKEQPFLHEKTTPFTCDNKYYTKLLDTEVNLGLVVSSDDGKSFYTITDNGIARYDIDSIQKRWEKSYHFGNIGNFFVRPDKKIWILNFDAPGYISGPFPIDTVFLIDTIGNIFLKKRVHGGIISGNNNNGFILAYNEYDSTEWVNYSFSTKTGKYFIESHDEFGNLLWEKSMILKEERLIVCVAYLQMRF